jgi:glycosyltransferase involved in cell wall biosynthesis
MCLNKVENMKSLTTSVIIPSFNRPEHLSICLNSLAQQTLLPDEIIVIWQADDFITRDTVKDTIDQLPYSVKLIHSPNKGIVPAENIGLDAAIGDIILLCDDDVITPPNWISRHLSFYVDSTIGAVGGSANNHRPDLALFPKRKMEPIGKLSWYGKIHGNMHDQIDEWKERQPIEVDHLVGYNLSFRRTAIDKFDTSLKSYWQLFEMEACLQVKHNGYRVIFDFINVVDHYPTNTAYAGGRSGDLQVKLFNPSYNNAFILAKYSPKYLSWIRLIYLFVIGTVGSLGLLSTLRAIKIYGNPLQELRLLLICWKEKQQGWKDGINARS